MRQSQVRNGPEFSTRDCMRSETREQQGIASCRSRRHSIRCGVVGRIPQEDEAASPQQQQQQQLLLQQQPAWSPRDPNGPHPSSAPAMTESYDPTEAPISSDFAAPSDVTLHGLLIVSAHLLADPKMPGACARREMSAGGTSDGAGIQAPMTPAVEVLRPHVFSFLRTVFSGNEMQPGSPGFSLAVELWMLWMRPWMAPAVLKGRVLRGEEGYA